MSSLYEQFFAVGAVKSLLTGNDISSLKDKPSAEKNESSDKDTTSLTVALKSAASFQR